MSSARQSDQLGWLRVRSLSKLRYLYVKILEQHFTSSKNSVQFSLDIADPYNQIHK